MHPMRCGCASSANWAGMPACRCRGRNSCSEKTKAEPCADNSAEVQRALAVSGVVAAAQLALLIALQPNHADQAQLLFQPVGVVFLGVLELFDQDLAAGVIAVLFAQC